MKIAILAADSLSAHNPLIGDAWPAIAERTLRAQGRDIQIPNFAIDGMTFARSMAAPEFGTNEWTRAVTSGPDHFCIALGGNDGWFNLDNVSAAQMQASAATLFNWARSVLPAGTMMFNRIQAAPPGFCPAYDAYLDFCADQARLSAKSIVIDTPYYMLRDAGLLLPDAQVFNLPAGSPLPLHPSPIVAAFMAQWFVRAIAPMVGYQVQAYAPWNDPAQALADLKAGGAAAQVLKAAWRL